MTDGPYEEAPAERGGGYPSSRQVAWYEVYAFAARWAASHDLNLLVNCKMVAGTPQWCNLPDDDARKLLALLLGGVREALTNDTRQHHLAEAAHAIAESADWSTVARRIRNGRGPAYIERIKEAS